MDEAIIGRERELGAVRRLLDRSRGSSGALVIDGEAGIGKTTVWVETVRTAQRDGMRVLQSRPAESEATFSYAAVADLVGSSFEETATELPPAQRRALAAALLLTETSERFNARTTSAALVGVFAALAARGPVLVAIDDAQWLDAASEMALAFAVRRLPDGLVLVAARRTERHDDDLPLGLARALPEQRLEHLVLAPLSLAALHHLIRSRLGISLSRPRLIRLAEASGGNPFFALEISRATDRARRDGSPDDVLPVPRSVEELIAARVADASDAAYRVALAVAALSQPTLAAIREALGDEIDASAALVEAEDAGLLTTERDRIRFTHPLLASVVYRSASPERRRQLHERLASIVADDEERARHLALSVTTPNDAVAFELERAASGAARRGAHDAAAELFAASRRLTPADQADALTRRALGEAAALLAAGDFDGARTRAEAEVDSPVASLRGQALHLLGEIAWISGSGPPRSHFEAALAAAPRDTELAARVYPKLVSYATHEPARAVAHAEAAMNLLSPERHSAALAQIVFDRFWAEIALGHGPRWDLFESWRRLEADAGPDEPKTPVAMIHFWSIDDFDSARERYAVEEQWYRERGEDLWRAERLAHLSMTELRAGRWDIAQSGIEEACDALAQLFDKPGPWGAAFRIRAHIDAHAGRTGRARETVLPFIAKAERAKLAVWEVIGLSTLAFIEFTDGDHRAVDEALTRMRERMNSVDMKEFAPDRSEPFHVESLLALGELERARAELSRLEHRGRSFPRLWITATLPRARALVLAAEGDVQGALDALGELDLAAAEKLPFDLAWTRLVQGRLHRRARHRRAAADTLAEALALFETLGAPTWEEQARAEVNRVGLRRSPDELTATEQRVAELAASGMTNREIASAAFMSPKTVEGNLAKIYRKLGITSRAELGARMAQRGRRVES